ncbi:hypothetical protein DLAC_00793 [Tieghemostelium lacteum]|uniref:Protein MON2 homolog n=1 Tax=Tieghemostelium lacteum TaxID=361077 RepID=A0A152A700_TIELA|nr:hypothetical protein DLAC_00793 [Tieghemostelium lacteum]|eukprot:KYR02000.1 hypothetical protein DLAC_00793 [Tieghemostelium lacteum]
MDKVKSLLTVLQSDLRSLSQEARNKFPQIKDASERGILKLKYLEEQSTTGDKLIQSLSKSEDVLKPFLMACDTKNQKLIGISIGSILKLISHSAISVATLPSLLGKMQMLIDVGSDESVQLKVLQGLLILITTIQDIHDDNLAQCLVLCFRLHSSKNTSIQSTSSATLPQIIRIIFDRVASELKAENEPLTELSFHSISEEIIENVKSLEEQQLQEDQPLHTSQQLSSSTSGKQVENDQPHDTTTEETLINSSDKQQQQPESYSSPETTSPVLQSTSSPNLAPLSPSLGDRPPVSLKPFARDAYLLLQDLCYITGGDIPVWLPPTTTISRASGLELIEMIISVQSEIFLKMEEFKFILKDRICPLLIKSFKFKMDFYHTVRLIRLITQFISKYSQIMVTESDVLLIKTIRMMDGDNPLWMQILSLESLRIYSEDPNLLRLFYTNYDKDNNSAKIFENMTSCIGKYVQNLYNLDSSNYTLVNTSKNRLFDQLWQNESPSIKENYIISVCTECIIGIVNAISKINNPDIECDSEIFPQMANSCWVSILGAISMLLSKAMDEQLIQLVLKALQSFTNTCGEYRLSAPRDALLTCLCKTTILPSFDIVFNENTFTSMTDKEEKSQSQGQTDKSDKDGGKSQGSSSQNSLNFYPTVKNILSVKILFNIAHCMGNLLDEAWILVLETLETWSKFLEVYQKKKDQSSQNQNQTSISSESSPKDISSPRITTNASQQQQQQQQQQQNSEIPILINSMDNLFRTSSSLDLRSIHFLLEALGKLCQSSFNLKSFNSLPNFFGISKLKETSLANINRIDKVWPFIANNITEAGNHKNPQFRKYAIEFLISIIKSTITQQQIQIKKDIVNNSTGVEITNSGSTPNTTTSTTTTTTKHDDIIQLEFFKCIEDLSFSNYSDTKEKLLESIHLILSSSGQSLTTAWPIILSVLLRMSQSNEKKFILIAFQSLELICNEFLGNLTPECLVLTIETISSFVSQKLDINISLTASQGLMSDLTYFLANENSIKTSKYQVSDGSAIDPLDILEENDDSNNLYNNNNNNSSSSGDNNTPQQQQQSPNSHSPMNSSGYYNRFDLKSPKFDQTRHRPSISQDSPYFVEKKRSLINRMWLCSFTCMKQLCVDARPPIRNGIVISLFQTLNNYVHLFERDLLDLILWTILFPLIEEVKSFSEKADQERIDSDLGGGVMLLVHHSRNTSQKQWDETQVLSISGLVRVFTTFFEVLSTLPSFKKAWDSLILTLETESKSTSKEVSMSSLGALHEIVKCSIIDTTQFPEISESVWEVLVRLSPKLSDPSTSAQKSLSYYIKVFLDHFEKTKDTLSDDQMLRVLHILYPLGLYIGDQSSDQLTNPQTHALQLIKSLPPISESIFPCLVSILLKYISIGINYHYILTGSSKFVFPPLPSSVKKDTVYYSPITEKSIELISELFLHPSTTDAMRSSIFEDIIKVLGEGMLTKYTKYHSQIWKISVSNLIRILPAGLLAINQDSVYLNDIKRNIVWSELIDSIQGFILHERQTHNISPEKRMEEDKYDIDLINAIAREMVGFSGIKVERVSIIRDRLVEILYEGSILSSQQREKVSQSCYQNMFSICSKADPSNQESIEIARVVLPVVLKRSREVLQRFVVDERQSGQCPLPRHRLNEISFLLKEIQELQLQPGIYQSQSDSQNQSKRPHLLDLFTILSDCICVSDREIKEHLKNIFYLVATEFLNIQITPSSTTSSNSSTPKSQH